MKTKAIKNLKGKVEAILRDYPQARDSDVWLTIKLWTLHFPNRIRRAGTLFTFRQHIVETIEKRQTEKPENFTENEWQMYQSQTVVWENMLKELDHSLVEGGYAQWLKDVDDLNAKQKLTPVPMIDLKTIIELPREDNIKRVRAKIQNEEHKYLPTTEEVRKQRKISEEEWHAWSVNQEKLL